jgi:large conductance mechanosensitive channel
MTNASSLYHGEVAEWSNASVSKTDRLERVSGVRISPSPQNKNMIKDQLKGFLEFIRTQGVVGLAVGLILGGAVTNLVTSLVKNLVNPLLGIVLGQAKDLATAYVGVLGAKIMYGNVILDLINFAVIAAIVYFGVKKLGLDKLDKPKN